MIEKAAELRIPVAPVCDGESILELDHVQQRGIFVDDPTGVSDAVYLNPSLFGSTSSSRRASESTQRP